MTEKKPQLISKRVYVPILSPLERRAYHIAHRIMTERPYVDRLATPGGQRSATIDGIARIIIEELTAEGMTND
jgi:hypothetical protein